MKRIIIIHPIDDSYGASKILSYVIAALSEEFKLEIWFKNDKKCLEDFLRNQIEDFTNISFKSVTAIPVVHSKIFSLRGLQRLIWEFVSFCFILAKNKADIDVVYINTYAAGLVSLSCKLLLMFNVVHCHENQKHKRSGKMLSCLIKKCADKIICVSDLVKSYVDNGKKSNKSIVIMNGITDPFEQTIGFKKINNTAPRFLIVGRVMPEKGYWFLADTIARLKVSLNISIRVDAYGDAPPNRKHLYKDYELYLKENGLEDSIFLHGFCSDADLKMFDYDVVLVPSIMSDPFPTTVLEAMRAQCLVVATNHGGAAEIISNNENGLLIEANDSCSFARLLLSINNGEIDIKKISALGRDFYSKNLTDKVFKKNIIDFFTSLR